MRTTALSVCLLATVLGAQTQLAYYFPTEIPRDSAVPPPSAVLGHEVGDWHVRHDQLAAYVVSLAEASSRVRIEQYGRTHEGRPLYLLAVSSPANLARLDQIRSAQVALDEGEDVDTTSMPLIAWMGYSVHGDESSGANASMLFAWHLASAQSVEIERWLDEAVILIDPCLNPDGLARFAHWANMHKGKVPAADPLHREHKQGWPSGRTNHYWFDLNRDWLLLTQPESRARLERFHQWRPHVVTDFHEMGSEATYFFQPGVRSRHHPLTPIENWDLTAQIARYNAAALDAIGSLYFTEEQFDDFYFGKGSTYPDLHGAIGILFEQASSRGHAQRTANGDLTFPFTIRNQLTTSMATLRGAIEKREDLHRWRQKFRAEARSRAVADPVKAWVFSAPEDPERVGRMIDVLLRHRIEVHALARDVDRDGRRFAAATSYVAAGAQDQYLLLKALFERRSEFKDETFYDVSAWTMPAAFGVESAELGEADFDAAVLGERVTTAPRAQGRGLVENDGLGPAPHAYAYAFEWSAYDAPRALDRLLAAGLRVRAVSTPIRVDLVSGEEPRRLDRGSIVVATGSQDIPETELRRILDVAALDAGIELIEIAGGLTPEGADLGSSSLLTVERPRAAILVGGEVSPYDAGAAWFQLDARWGLPVTLLDLSDVAGADLTTVSHLVIAGDRVTLPEAVRKSIRDWVETGGIVVAISGASASTEAWLLPALETAKTAAAAADKEKRAEQQPWGERAARRARSSISGAILRARLDVTHPLGFGYARDEIQLFRTGTHVLRPAAVVTGNVAVYADEPLYAGYCSGENRDRLRGTAAVAVDRIGKGGLVRFADDPNFRAWFHGTSKLFANALYFSRAALAR